MNADNILSLAKSLSSTAKEEVRITFPELLKLYPDITIEQVAKIIINLPGVQLTDGNLGGIIIPAEYFESN